MLHIRNWERFQHYKFRSPPWIKLYKELLDEPKWHNLSDRAAKGLIMLWLIASEQGGYLPDSKTLAFRLRISENELSSLISQLSEWLEGDASEVLARRYQLATTEKSREETEKRREEERRSAKQPKSFDQIRNEGTDAALGRILSHSRSCTTETSPPFRETVGRNGHNDLHGAIAGSEFRTDRSGVQRSDTKVKKNAVRRRPAGTSAADD